MEQSISHEHTKNFLEGLWYAWASRLVRDCAHLYSLSKEQHEAIEQILLRPNDWILEVAAPLNSS